MFNSRKCKLIFVNWCYINISFFAFNVIYFVIYAFSFGLNYGFGVGAFMILEIIYFIGGLGKNVYYQRNTFKLIDFLGASPISLIIGKLGTGKTLLLTYLNVIMKLKTDNLYTNYPIDDKNSKVITFKNFDFNDRTKLIPTTDSFIGFDESFLYIDGTDPKNTKQIHNGKIPGILLARHFGNHAVFSSQRPSHIGNEIRELA